MYAKIPLFHVTHNKTQNFFHEKIKFPFFNPKTTVFVALLTTRNCTDCRLDGY